MDQHARTSSPLGRAAASRAAPGQALAADAPRIVGAARAMAARFRHAGRLLTFGDGAAAADAGHVAVEFTHPVLMGKRALPAICLANDVSALTGDGYPARLRLLARPGDIAMGILTQPPGGRETYDALAAARELGLLTIALTMDTPPPHDPEPTAPAHTPAIDPVRRVAVRRVAVRPDPAPADPASAGLVLADHVLAARTADPLIAREIHITTYHLLWELVHLFLEVPGTPGAPATLAPPEASVTPAPSACHPGGSCVTCSDTAVPVHITELRPGGLALATTGSGTEEISVALVQAQVGDVVLVHAKEAIAVLGGEGR